MFVSRTCPPLFEVPEHVRKEGGKGVGVLHQYLRMHPVKAGEGVIGSVWREKAPLLLRGEDGRLDPARHGPRRTNSAMVTPLIYGGHDLGVLVVTRTDDREPFLKSEFQIFKAISEQSAFALSTATIFSDAAEKKRLDQDLQVAYEIQRILLPASAPEVAGFQIAGINIPARQVSGDYYDYVTVDPEHCGIAIADVSGKGVPASLIMATCRSVLRSQAAGQRKRRRGAPPGQCADVPRYQGRHVHLHGLRHSGEKLPAHRPLARRTRCAAPLLRAQQNHRPHQPARDGHRHRHRRSLR